MTTTPTELDQLRAEVVALRRRVDDLETARVWDLLQQTRREVERLTAVIEGSPTP